MPRPLRSVLAPLLIPAALLLASACSDHGSHSVQASSNGGRLQAPLRGMMRRNGLS